MILPKKGEVITDDGHHKLHSWFGLSYASFLTIPRVFLQEMPDEWKGKMSDLLEEYDEVFCNPPDVGFRVQITVDGKMVKTPDWVNYRYPRFKVLNGFKARTESNNSLRRVYSKK